MATMCASARHHLRTWSPPSVRMVAINWQIHQNNLAQIFDFHINLTKRVRLINWFLRIGSEIHIGVSEASSLSQGQHKVSWVDLVNTLQMCTLREQGQPVNLFRKHGYIGRIHPVRRGDNLCEATALVTQIRRIVPEIATKYVLQHKKPIF